VDAGTLPVVRSARNWLGRVPVPGLCDHWECRQHRPGLRPLARAPTAPAIGWSRIGPDPVTLHLPASGRRHGQPGASSERHPLVL